MIPSQKGGMAEPDHRHGADRLVAAAVLALVAASVASGTAMSTAKIVRQTSSQSVGPDPLRSAASRRRAL